MSKRKTGKASVTGKTGVRKKAGVKTKKAADTRTVVEAAKRSAKEMPRRKIITKEPGGIDFAKLRVLHDTDRGYLSELLKSAEALNSHGGGIPEPIRKLLVSAMRPLPEALFPFEREDIEFVPRGENYYDSWPASNYLLDKLKKTYDEIHMGDEFKKSGMDPFNIPYRSWNPYGVNPMPLKDRFERDRGKHFSEHIVQYDVQQLVRKEGERGYFEEEPCSLRTVMFCVPVRKSYTFEKVGGGQFVTANYRVPSDIDWGFQFFDEGRTLLFFDREFYEDESGWAS